MDSPPHYEDPEAPETSPSQRICKRKECSRNISSFKNDPHSFCVKCRGFCTVDSRCEECANWSPDLMIRISKWQRDLQNKRESRAKCKAKRELTSGSIEEVASPSVNPSDSVSKHSGP